MEKIKFESNPKLYLSREFQQEITAMHAMCPAKTEWSGPIFYEVLKGTIKEPSTLEMRVKHLFPIDIGTHSYTEYEIDEDIIDFYDEYDEAINWKMGHCHTHHDMGTSPSGTDIEEIRDNVKHHNYYLSLIVNYAGNYTAIIGVEIESEGRQGITTETGEKYYWDLKAKKDCFMIDVDVIFEASEWFIDQVDAIRESKTNVRDDHQTSFMRFLLNKKKGKIRFVNMLDAYAKRQKWNNKTSATAVKSHFGGKLKEWASTPGQGYKSQYELEKFYTDIEDYKNKWVRILAEALDELIDDRKAKYNYAGSRINGKQTRSPKNSKVSGRQLGTLGFSY